MRAMIQNIPQKSNTTPEDGSALLRGFRFMLPGATENCDLVSVQHSRRRIVECEESATSSRRHAQACRSDNDLVDCSSSANMHLSTISIAVAAVIVGTALGLPQGCLSSVTVNGTSVCSMPKSISPIIGKVNANASETTTATYYTPSHEEVLSALGHTSPTSSDDQVIPKMTPSPESSAISIAGVVTDLHNYYDHMDSVISTTYRTFIVKHISGPTYHTTISSERPTKSKSKVTSSTKSESKVTSSTKSKSKAISSTKSKSIKSSLLSERTPMTATPVAAAAATSSKTTKRCSTKVRIDPSGCTTFGSEVTSTSYVDCRGCELEVKTENHHCLWHTTSRWETGTAITVKCMETSSPVMDL
ncbi:hypothetical protein AUEXF2481DRAFT_91741 [Aureobasidium subglaciale EXF-2481]|uniref:Uncharacterized protein n=1 Tax=Aureobasidium subglaciale (strain EXF-2481) TaxID=1043005 RepID=A0A074Y2D3_AURSE|nr:uncharacterized protein AUEXF2481DRAFT_91741 [Aureobasidium subglaciale EXF-2481]KEQ91880.1 hypothetical protein AUEXF2481DRAFT_91741 [Aureobasidium subglaciale EXF-2481]